MAWEAVRTQLLTLGAGVFAVGALTFTARNFVLSRRTVELTRQTLELAQQAQVTDRHTKAIQHLGSDKLDVRIGGLYALERVARDSACRDGREPGHRTAELLGAGDGRRRHEGSEGLAGPDRGKALRARHLSAPGARPPPGTGPATDHKRSLLMGGPLGGRHVSGEAR